MTRTRTITLVAIAALAGLAIAQAPGEDPAQLGNGLLVLFVGGAVAWFRSTPLGERLDGPVAVPAFALAAGAITAAGFEAAGLLGFSPFVEGLGRWPGALAAGAIVGAEAVFGVSLYKYGAKVWTKGKDGQTTFNPGALTGVATGLVGDRGTGGAPTAASFVLDAARAILGREPIGAAATAVLPLVAHYAQSPAVLTDDLRAKIQAQVLEALRKAGLTGTDLGDPGGQDPA